jgi:hypothetical protein
MTVLDELREALQNTVAWRTAGWNGTKEDVLATLDAFEAAHPGLVDLTAPCAKCGAPADGIQRCPYCLSRSVQWHDDEYIGCAGCGEVYHDRGTAFRPENDAVSLCSACAKEANDD